MAGVLEFIVGPWGAALVSLGLVVSVGGAFLELDPSVRRDTLYLRQGWTFPRWFAGRTPALAQELAMGDQQPDPAVPPLNYFSQNAYDFFLSIASVAILPPYVFSGAYALNWRSGETYGAGTEARNRDMVVGALATIYGIWLIYAARLSTS